MNITVDHFKIPPRQGRYFSISSKRNKEMGIAQDKGKSLLKQQGLNKALEHAYIQIGKDVGQYGTYHPYTATAFHQAAILHAEGNQPLASLNLFKISHDVHKQNGADENVNNCTSYGSLATSYFALGRYEEALDAGLKALKLYKASPEAVADPATIRKQWELSQVYLALGKKKQRSGDYADARELYAEGLKHAEEARQTIRTHLPNNPNDNRLSNDLVQDLKKQADPSPLPDWLPSGTIQDLITPFEQNNPTKSKNHAPLATK